MKYRYPFIKWYKRTGNKFLDNAQKALYTRILRLPRKPGTSILRDKGWNVYMGDLWWSITETFARVVVSMEEEIMPYWEECYVSDETFAQTIIMQLPEFREHRSNEKTRLIDWGRGRPYIWRVEDFDYLMQSNAMFARKFSPTDLRVVDMIYTAVMKRKE